MAATTCVGIAELPDLKLARAAEHGGVDPEGATNQRDKPARRRRYPSGFSSVVDLVERAPLGRSALYREIKEGRLRTHQWRGRMVVADADFRRWLAAAPVPPAGHEDVS